ncbi:GNAT family N-acetyltransferase [Fundicoccus culcitae]|uniref:GNAT family N-acetyltransferase n=1 Tax=Fundicoccus culcitae TaxID=2969821 RepID=A0ABY5P7V2_9LACT|nr:GNAT family N-acetyltransferase [Fundicoccus culcitae]UUX34675.1 GNAT family N-acetyltransferase [Fundicoccus culcitae]
MNFQTERLQIRPILESDEAEIFAIHSDAETCRYMLHEPWTDATRAEAFSKRLKQNQLSQASPVTLAVVLDNQVIGELFVWYTEMKETVEIGYVFNRAFHGHGYAFEAIKALLERLFTDFSIHRVQANLDARNKASEKLCYRLGMRKEAHFLQDYWTKGEWTDSFVFGLLQEEFVSNKKIES